MPTIFNFNPSFNLDSTPLIPHLITAWHQLSFIICCGMLCGYILNSPQQSFAHPHTFYAATDEAVAQPPWLSGLAKSYTDTYNAYNRYQLILAEAKDHPDFEEFYVCLADRPPNTELQHPYCVSAFHLSAPHAETSDSSHIADRVLLPKGALLKWLEQSNNHTLIHSLITEEPTNQYVVPYGGYYEQEEESYQFSYPFNSEHIVDGKINQTRRFNFQAHNSTIAINIVLHNWLILNQTFLPVRVPILLPALGNLIQTAGLNSLLDPAQKFYHCLLIFEQQRWTPDRIVKSCRLNQDKWDNTRNNIYSATTSKDTAEVISLDYLDH